MQPRAGRQGQQIDARGGDALAEVGRPNDETLLAKLIEQFGVDQMHLAQIGLRRIPADARTMLDRLAHMRVAGDLKTLEQAYAQARRLAEMMAGTGTEGEDAAHPRSDFRHASPNTRLKIVSTCLK